MANPEALVTVTVKELRDLPAAVGSANHAYLLLWIGERLFGRSRKITAGSIDLTAEPQPWRLELAVRAGEVIPLRLALWDDRGDDKPIPLLTASGTIADPWASGEVELFADPKLIVEVDTLRGRFASDVGRVRRSTAADQVSATLRVRRAVTLEIIDVLGLYKPGHNPGSLGRPRRLAEYQAGYHSEDQRGRIYINHDLNGDWAFNQQLIQLTVKVTPHGTQLPAGTKVKWTLIDPDDPTDDDPHYHREAGRYTDPDDYDAAGVHTGARGNDNVRSYDESGSGTPGKIFDRLPPWQQVSGFALSGATNSEAKTAIDAASRESKVKLHCPDVGGANLVVKAELDPPLPVPTITAQTGVMTMWKRIDVEVVRMDGAFSLTPLVSGIPVHYEPAYVQMDFHPERVLSADPADSPDHIAPNDKLQTPRSSAWVNRVFQHRNDPGWFFLGSAKRASPPPPGKGAPPLFDSDDSGSSYTIGRGSDYEYVELNTALAQDAAAVVFTWDVNGKSERKVFRAYHQELLGTPPASTRVRLMGHDIQSQFTGHDSDGSLAHAYAERMEFYMQGCLDQSAGAFVGSGYGITAAAARCQVLAARPSETAGISPSIKRGSKGYFAGRTIIFCHHPNYADHNNSPPTVKARFTSDIPSVITHEFAHAFGMPHKCGYWDHRTPREESCCMNYSNHWLLVPGRHDQMQPQTANKRGPRLCARHAMEIRRVHLERNKGLRWR